MQQSALCAGVRHGHTAGQWEWKFTEGMQFLMVCLLMFMLVVAFSCLWMVIEEAIQVCKACLWMKRFSWCVVFLGHPDLYLSCTLSVARKRWFSLHMTEWKTPSRLATYRLETWYWSHAMVSPLSMSVTLRSGRMIRTSLTVAKCLLIKPQM